MKVRNQKEKEKVELQMTPMIDIVFQLLVFFIMTFKIVTPEGDFNIKMPLAAPSEGNPDEDLFPPIKIRLMANAAGDISGIQMGDKAIRDWNMLKSEVFQIVRTDSGPDAGANFEVELDCDYNLHYQHVIKAISTVTGERQPDGTVVKFIEKVKFAPPRQPGS